MLVKKFILMTTKILDFPNHGITLFDTFWEKV